MYPQGFSPLPDYLYYKIAGYPHHDTCNGRDTCYTYVMKLVIVVVALFGIMLLAAWLDDGGGYPNPGGMD